MGQCHFECISRDTVVSPQFGDSKSFQFEPVLPLQQLHLPQELSLAREEGAKPPRLSIETTAQFSVGVHPTPKFGLAETRLKTSKEMIAELENLLTLSDRGETIELELNES